MASALEMARVERDLGISTTYHLIPGCSFYDCSRELVATFRGYGHEVGLHSIDGHWWNYKLSQAMGTTHPMSASFHRPAQHHIRENKLYFDGTTIIDAYSEKLMENYISDSRGEFSFDSFKKRIENVTQFQILIHPIWDGS